MDVITAINSLLGLMNMMSNLQANAAQVTALIQKAQSEGRTTFTPEEWAVVQGADTAARNQLIAAVTAALTK